MLLKKNKNAVWVRKNICVDQRGHVGYQFITFGGGFQIHCLFSYGRAFVNVILKGWT